MINTVDRPRSRVLLLVAALGTSIMLTLGLMTPATADTVKMTRPKGPVSLAVASYDGVTLGGKVVVRRSIAKSIISSVGWIELDGVQGGDRWLTWNPKDGAVLKSAMFKKVACPGLSAGWKPSKRSFKWVVQVPATCLADAPPSQVQVSWTVNWRGHKDRANSCPHSTSMPKNGLTRWLVAANPRQSC